MQTIFEKAVFKGINLNNKEWLWYGTYCLVLIILFLHILFPSETVKDYLIRNADRVYPDLKVTLDKIGLSFPLGIKIKGLGISFENDPDINVYESENSTIRPAILTYFAGNQKYFFRSSTMGGNISGFVQNAEEKEKNEIKARIIFKDIHLDDRVFIHPLITRRFEGSARGEINFTGNLSLPENGDFDISLEIFDGKIKLLDPILKLEAIDFYEINLTAEMKNKKISIAGTELLGNGIKGTASGTIRLNDDFLTSRLDLKGELEFSSTFFQDMPDVQNAISILTSGNDDGKLSFNVKGTIEKPRFNFNRR